MPNDSYFHKTFSNEFGSNISDTYDQFADLNDIV